MDHDPYFDPPPSGGEDYAMHPGPPPHRSDEHHPLSAGQEPGDQVGSKRQRSPPRYDRYDRDPHDRGADFARDRSPRRRRFDGPPGGGFPEGRRVVVRGRGRGRGAARDDEPLSFREFCVRHVSDAATPAEAEHRYEQYKRDHAEAFRRRDFERFARDDPKVRAKHDPRAIEEAIKRRAEMARDAAREFEEDLANGKVPTLPPAKSSGPLESKDLTTLEPSSERDAEKPMAMDSSNVSTEGTDVVEGTRQKNVEKRKDARGRWPVPDAAWAPTRLAFDLSRLDALVAALDEEKRVRTFDDSSLTDPASAEEKVEGGKKADDVFRDAEDVSRALDEVSDVAEDVTEQTLALLDLLAAAADRRVCYLWRVHGVDYYAGAELTADEYVARPPSARVGEGEGCLARGERPNAEALSGVARAFAEEQRAHLEAEREKKVGGERASAEDAAPKPEDGAAEDGEDKDTVLVANANATKTSSRVTNNTSSPASKWASRVDRCWRVRLEQGDASLARAGRDVVDSELEAWKRSCVVQHEENRFGCTLSSKMFVAPEFVLKHINVKQADAVNRQRDVILDRLFLENYLAARRDEEKSARREKRAERRAKGDEGRGGARAGRAAKQEMRALAKSIVKDKEGQGLGGKDGAPKAGKSYNDLDAPKVDRVVLDYGDI